MWEMRHLFWSCCANSFKWAWWAWRASYYEGEKHSVLLSSRLKPKVPTRPSHHINITVRVLLCGEANVLFQRIHTHIPRDKWSTSVQQRWRGSWLWRSQWPAISGPSIYCLSHWYAQASGFNLLGLCYSKELNLNGKKWALTKAGGFIYSSDFLKEVRLLQQRTFPHIKQSRAAELLLLEFM